MDRLCPYIIDLNSTEGIPEVLKIPVWCPPAAGKHSPIVKVSPRRDRMLRKALPPNAFRKALEKPALPPKAGFLHFVMGRSVMGRSVPAPLCRMTL